MSKELRKSCVLCAEVADSAYLHKKLGDAETEYAVERCLHRMQRASARFNGRVAKSGGAAHLMAVFDAVEDAFLAANEMQLRVADLPPVSGIKLAIKVGYHYGPALEESGAVTGDAATRAWRLAAIAKPGQILISAETLCALPPVVRRSVRDPGEYDDLELADDGKSFEVLWQDPAIASQNDVLPAHVAAPGDVRLNLRHGSQQLALGHDKLEVALGRDPRNDIVINDPRASRVHARIQRRYDQFIIADRSSNGTYVAFDGGEEVALRRKELILHGRGLISFGRAYGPETADVVEFELLRD